MKSEKTLTNAGLSALVSDLLSEGARVVAPVASGETTFDRVDFKDVKDAGEMVFAGPLPKRSIKEFFLPPTEVVLRWKQKKGDVELFEVPTQCAPMVIFGARPCDAAAPEIVDGVMGWGCRDELWFGRRDATTIIGVACAGVDKSCFCTAVGLGPDRALGSDLFLTQVEDGYHVSVETDRGEALVRAHQKRFGAPSHADAVAASHKAAREKVEGNLRMDPAAVRTFVEKNFDHPYWARVAQRCHGCGACASSCPTCHCFDLVDEPNAVDSGERRRNWDTCQTGKFTLHASGHNPRGDQSGRFRQRVTHKFSIYKGKFDRILCTGCGRCARVCPGGMDLPEILGELSRLAKGGV